MSKTVESIIQYKNAFIGYGKKNILENISFDIPKGEYTALIGANGSGKTTLIKSMLGIIPVQRGQIEIEKNIKLSYVPQRDSLDTIFPLTTWEVVAMGLYASISWRKFLTKEHRNKIKESIDLVELTAKSSCLFRELSGGQRQRALLARALVSSPSLIILDEPTTGMDLRVENETLNLLKKLQIQNATSIIVVTHNLNMALKYAHNIGILYNKQIMFGTTEDVITPENLKQIFHYDVRIVEVEDQKIVLGGI